MNSSVNGTHCGDAKGKLRLMNPTGLCEAWKILELGRRNWFGVRSG